ncbi:MAG: heme exporter protein CcmB [Coriobacteriia bacterium]|nr:heme exporter protein CcmB [Coriobacteriia bacterium]
MAETATAAPKRSSSWRQFKAILRKDIVMELRTKEMLSSMTLYTLLTLVIYQIALSQSGSGFDIRLIAAGLVWLAFVFTSMLGLNRSLVHEKDQGCLEALLLAPVDRPVIFFAKAVGNLIFLLIVEVVTVPIFAVAFMSGRPIAGPFWMLVLSAFVGSLGIAGVGTFLATMAVNARGGSFILSVLFIPLMYPALLAAVAGSSAVVLGGEGYAATFWQAVGMGAGIDAIMLLAVFALYEFVVGA